MSEDEHSAPHAENTKSGKKKKPAEKPMPRIVIWGGWIGAIVLIGLLIFVYFLVLGDERPGIEALTRTEAAISGEEARLIQVEGTAEELHRLLERLESGETAENGQEEDGQDSRDPFLPPEVVRRMAWWMVDHYFPAGTHPQAQNTGILTTGISSANTQTTALLNSVQETAIGPRYLMALDYLFTRDMLEELYLMHAKTFVAAFSRALEATRRNEAGAMRGLTDAEKAECVALYAQALEQISRGLSAYRSLPENSRRLNAWLAARERLLEATKRATSAQSEFDRLPAEQQSQERRQLAQLAVRAREQALQAEARTQENLLEALRQNPAVVGIDSGTLLYIASWAERRIVARRENSTAMPTAIDILLRIARDLKSMPIPVREAE